MKPVLSLVLLVIATCTDAAEWDGLRVTWSLNPFSKWGFNSLPRKVTDLTKDFKLRDDQCSTANAKFLGKRYWYQEDPAVTLLFDKNGIIAGIQTSAPKSVYPQPPAPVANHQYVEDGDHWTLTAYFVDPSIICGSGRSDDDFVKQGTGVGLWLQMGPNPVKDSVKIPSTEKEVQQTKWKLGHCFVTMGNHYWHNVTKDMNCENFLPYCLLYNKGKLTAFCFSMNAQLTSPRYEHPPEGSAKMFIDPVPDCFSTVESYKKPSTMHVYMVDNARTSSWC